MNKTTPDHYAEFQRYVLAWQRKLGLSDWNIYFRHKKLSDSYAMTHWRAKGRVATVELGTMWPERPVTSQTLDRCALHECLHLVMADLYNEALARYTQEFDIERAEESTVVRLENAIISLTLPDA